MAMPKTPVDKDGNSIFGQYNIRSSWQVFAMQAEPITLLVKPSSNDHLWRRVRRTDSPHYLAPISLCKLVGQFSTLTSSLKARRLSVASFDISGRFPSFLPQHRILLQWEAKDLPSPILLITKRFSASKVACHTANP